MELHQFSIKQIHQHLLQKDFSAHELTEHYLGIIKKEESKIGAFLLVSDNLALEQADVIDEKINQGQEISWLAGAPCAIKDAILVEGQKCTAGSRILENYLAPYDATAVAKLKKQGAIILGKTNLDEFAMGSSTEHSAFQITRNPHDLARVPGGTSGGSASAVAANECVFALGSDTGGSIRQPASFCGVVGLKPTYGAVSRYGLIAHASSLDQIGPLAKTVEDCQIIFDAIKGKDEHDATSVEAENSSVNVDLKNVKIGIPKEYFGEGLEKETRSIIEGVIKKAEKAGAKIQEISLPHSKYALACYYLVSTSEASANLARFDGIKYGMSCEANDLAEVYLKSRGHGFGSEVKRRIMLGTFALSSGYYDAFYAKAQKVRTMIKQDFDKAFEQVDFIFTPVSPFPAFKIGEKIDDPLKMYLSDILTVPISLAGVPALSLPVGQDGHLPVGLQIISRPFNEKGIFQISQQLEKIL
ncbi:MAG: Asp-tRNA(Asn)/Glu-tRNA(Gln) amidotransferase subunit GatA [Candidatus Gribaldobacteria bacterium]|nr:Asp-tRNA(Asn)/Glu-tRNA(Gln) amidotransferase subunit GatA [Candidatus Gribaldobacteria bacterium]